MAEYDDDDVLNDEDGQPQDDSPRGLRRAANKSKKLEAELAELRRELAFAKAGLPMDDPKMKYFVKGYEGDMEPDAIRAAAAEAGFLAANPQAGAQAAVAESQARVMSAAAGAVYEDASEEAALARLEAAMQEGGVEAMLDVARQYGIPVAIDQ